MLIDVGHFISTKLAKYDLPDDAVNACELRVMLMDEPEAVVRCRDCRYYEHWSEQCALISTRLHFYEKDKRWTPDSFCAWGERREDETD